jgi:curved DNA-binding protein
VDGRDVYLDLPVAPWEAALGAVVDVPLPDGSVQLSVPAGSGQGRKLRLKGKGIPGKTPGDLYVLLHIAMPPQPDDAQRKAWAELARQAAFNPRAHMGAT